MLCIYFNISFVGLFSTPWNFPNAVKTIFEDFSQEDNTISKKYGGTGLGLSISKKLVSILGGQLEVESDIGIGTKFHFKLVLERIDQKMNEESQIPEQNIDWTNIQILTVEDNPVNQFVILKLFWSPEIDDFDLRIVHFRL